MIQSPLRWPDDYRIVGGKPCPKCMLCVPKPDKYINVDDQGRCFTCGRQVIVNQPSQSLFDEGLHSDPVNQPSHYRQGKMECIDALEGLGLTDDYYLANAVKYIVRCRYKSNMNEDIEKAIWYLRRKLHAND